MTLASLDSPHNLDTVIGRLRQTCNRVGISDILLVQGTRMEERLDDAINVLRNHAESQLGLHLGPVGPHGSIYSHTSPPQLDHLVRPLFLFHLGTERTKVVFLTFVSIVPAQTSPHPAVTVTQPQGSYSGLTPTPDTDGSIKIERLPVTNASKFPISFESCRWNGGCRGEVRDKRGRRALTIGDRCCALFSASHHRINTFSHERREEKKLGGEGVPRCSTLWS